MSKEQTPIEQEMLIYFNGKRGTYLNKAQIREVSEFLNTKVLEALEREIPIAHDKGFDREYISMNLNREVFPKGVQYYETEVKPKYE